MAGGDASSTRELAAALGKSHTAVNRWLKDDRWPFARKPPWAPAMVAQIRAWAARTLAPNPGAADAHAAPARTGTDIASLSPERQAKLALSLAKVERATFENQARKGEWHRVDDCRQRRVRQITDLRVQLLDLADALPFSPDDKEIVRGRVLELCRRFAGVSTAPPPAAPKSPAKRRA